MVLFLVGESPTFGLQPEAFRHAAKCATAFNILNRKKASFPRATDYAPLKQNCSDLWGTLDRNANGTKLNILGPTFSGSMHSLALGLGDMLRVERPKALTISVISPSATVKSNDKVKIWLN